MTDTLLPIFNPRLPRTEHRRGEWVSLDGGRVYVREMNARDSLFVLEHSQRPPGPNTPPSLNIASMQTWQIVVSCYNGEGSEAERIFAVTDIEVIQNLRAAEWRKLLDAIERVNMLSDSEVSELESFTPAPEGDSSETALSGVSSISTGFPERLSFPRVNSSQP